MKPNPNILIIDADRPVRRHLRLVLEPQRYRVFEAETGEAGIRTAVERQPDVIILELALPDSDGLDVLGQLREWNRSPIMILSAQSGEEKKVAALDVGANDFVSKPFGAAELLARLRVLQRANPAEAEGPFYINGDVQVDIAARAVTVHGRRIDFTPTEEVLFYVLARHAGLLVTCKHLVRCVWGGSPENKLHDLHVYIRSLRRKLEENGGVTVIQTEGSAGYRLLVPQDTGSPRNQQPEMAI
jgi:two-component system KDP operon response regulator KdpE